MLISLPVQAESKIGSKSLNLAFHYYYAEDYVKAKEYFERHLRFDGDHEVALRFLARISAINGKYDDSIEYLKRAVKADPKSTEAYMMLGSLYQNKSDIDNALATYEKVFGIDPFHEQAIVSLATLYGQKNDRRRSTVFFKRLVVAINKHGGSNIELLYRAHASLGNNYYQDGDYSRAIYHYTKLLELDSSNIRVMLILGELYKITGKFETAISTLQELLEIKPNYQPALDSLAECYYITEDRRARATLQHLTETSNQSNDLIKAMLAELNRKDSEAEQYFAKVLQYNANRLSVHIGLAKIYRRAKNYELLKNEAFSVIVLAQRIGAYKVAQRHFDDVNFILDLEAKKIDFEKKFFVKKSRVPLLLDEKVERLAYDHTEALSTHAATLDGLGKANQAIVFYNQSLKYLRQLREWYSWQSENLDESQLEALKTKKELIAKKTERIQNREYKILLNLGWLLQDKPLLRYEEALRMQKKARKILPKRPQADFLSGIILYNMGEGKKQKQHYSAAASHLETAINLYLKENQEAEMPSSYYFYLGMALEKTDNFKEAEMKLEKAIELDPYNATYLNYLGYMYSLRGMKLAEARNLLVRALDDDPENEAYLDSLGWVYFKEGRYRDALAQLLQAANHAERKSSMDSVIYFHLAETYYKLKDYSLAHFYYSKALEHIDKASEEMDVGYIKKQIAKINSDKKKK